MHVEIVAQRLVVVAGHVGDAACPCAPCAAASAPRRYGSAASTRICASASRRRYRRRGRDSRTRCASGNRAGTRPCSRACRDECRRARSRDSRSALSPGRGSRSRPSGRRMPKIVAPESRVIALVFISHVVLSTKYPQRPVLISFKSHSSIIRMSSMTEGLQARTMPAAFAVRRVTVIFNPTSGRRRWRRLAHVLDALAASGCTVILARNHPTRRRRSVRARSVPRHVRSSCRGRRRRHDQRSGQRHERSRSAAGTDPARYRQRAGGGNRPVDTHGRHRAHDPARHAAAGFLGRANARKFAMMAGVGFDALAVTRSICRSSAASARRPMSSPA